MSPALWLAVRDVLVRRRRVALAAAVVAAIATATTAMELVSRAREEAVAVQIDAMGPALTVLAPGVSAGSLARYDLGDRVLRHDVPARVSSALGSKLRTLESRLVVTRDVGGTRAPVVGVEPDPLPPGAPDGAFLGSELARRLRNPAAVSIHGRQHGVAGVLPSTGSAEDMGVLMPLAAVQALTGISGVNELRIFLRAGVSPRDAEARLAATLLDAVVVRRDRGEVADGGAQASLEHHRGFAYAILAIVAGLCLVIAAYLDAAERRVEIATLVAIGAARWTVLGALLSRSALVSIGGTSLGVFAGSLLAAVQDPRVSGALPSAWSFGAAMVGAALAIGVAAAAPTALAMIARDPVAELQEG